MLSCLAFGNSCVTLPCTVVIFTDRYWVLGPVTGHWSLVTQVLCRVLFCRYAISCWSPRSPVTISGNLRGNFPICIQLYPLEPHNHVLENLILLNSPALPLSPSLRINLYAYIKAMIETLSLALSRCSGLHVGSYVVLVWICIFRVCILLHTRSSTTYRIIEFWY